MRIDYIHKNLAPKGKELHEHLVDYAKAFLAFNIDMPAEYIHKDVQIGEIGNMQIVDIAAMPDSTYRERPYKSIAIECGNLTGDAVEHLLFTAKHFDVVGWIPYPYMSKLDKYLGDIIDILQELNYKHNCRFGVADIIHPNNIKKQGNGFYIPESKDGYDCVAFDETFGELFNNRVLVQLISLNKKILNGEDAFGLYSYGTLSLVQRDKINKMKCHPPINTLLPNPLLPVVPKFVNLMEA